MASVSDETADQMAAAATAEDDLTHDPILVGEADKEQLNSSDSIQNSVIPPSSKELKEEKREAERKENKHDDLKSTLLISGIVVAAVGALFAVLKKIKEA